MRVATTIALLLLSGQVLAWGADGHRLVCQLAYNGLSDDAKAFVAETLAMGEMLDGNGENDFAGACVWADEARNGDYRGTWEQHFINVPRHAQGINFARDCAAMDCIAVGLQRNLTYLSQMATGEREQARKAAALRFLGHFVGDLYQPLHVGHGEDRGGNRIRVRWFTEETNLHHVWDSGIMARANLRYPDSLPLLASAIAEEVPDNVLDAMANSFKLARSHAYPNIRGVPIRAEAELGEAYFERGKPVVIRQLATAGSHLAILIEGLVDGTLNTNILIE